MTTDSIQFVVLVVMGFVFVILLCNLLLKGVPVSKQKSKHGRVDESQEFTRITISAPDGKVLETLTVKTDSISYDSEGSFEAMTNEGKNVDYLTHGFLVKMEDL